MWPSGLPPLVLLVVLVMTVVPVPLTAGLARDQVVMTQFGPMRGRLSSVVDGRQPRVMQYLGVPYAHPPVDKLRFLPPKTPIYRAEVQDATRLPPGCPQRPPPVTPPLRAGRRYRPTPPHPQSEDCLHLNIYAPVTEDPQRSRKRLQHPLPVLVYIHGEMPGEQAQPVDGTVLASFGEVIVVTVNYRLGVLGFLKPSVNSGSTLANIALYDQRAALIWLRENIANFSGDPDNITVMGHGTGAVCASLLAISPENSGPKMLFHRAILMSGSALSPWAMIPDPVHVTVRLAKALNCSMSNDGVLLECLRSKSVHELVNVDFQWPRYAPSLSPSEDPVLVPRWPREPADLAHSLSRIDLLFGVTTQTELELLSERQLEDGITREDRDKLLKSFLRGGYRRDTQQLLEMATNRYRDTNMNVIRYRDKTLELLSDASVVAPLVRLADIHAESTRSAYMYVFSHVTNDGGNRLFGSAMGDELPYVFGDPLSGESDVYFTQYEKSLSEYMMTSWTSFAKTGDPNNRSRRQDGFISDPSGDSPFLDLVWRQYDQLNKRYMELHGTRPGEHSRYRHVEVEFWNQVVLGHLAFSPAVPEDPAPEDYDTLLSPLPPSGPGGPVFPPPPLAPSTPPPRQYPHTLPPPPPAPPDDSRRGGGSRGNTEQVAPAAATGMLSIVIVVGVCFVLLNLLILGGVYYQKQRLKMRERRLQRQSSLSEGGSRSASVRSSRESVVRPRMIARSASGDDLLALPGETANRVTISEGNGGVHCPRRASDGSHAATRRETEGGALEPPEATDGDRPSRGGPTVTKERSLDQAAPRSREPTDKTERRRGSEGATAAAAAAAGAHGTGSRTNSLGRERAASRAGAQPVSRSGSARSRNSVASASLPRASSTSLHTHGTPHSQRSATLKQANKSAGNKSPREKKKGITLSEKSSFAQDLLQRVMPKSQTKQPAETPGCQLHDRPPRGILKTRTPTSPASDSSGIYSEMVPALRGSVSGLSMGSGCRVVYRTDSTCQVDLPVDPDDEDGRDGRPAGGREPDSASVDSARSLQLSCTSSVGGRSTSSIHFVPRAVVPVEPRVEPPEFPTVRFETDPVTDDRSDVLTALRRPDRSAQRPETAGYRRSIASVPSVGGIGNGGGEPAADAARCMSLQRSCERRPGPGRQKPPPPPRTSSRPEGLYAARDVTCPHGYPVHPPPPGADSLERFVPGQAESPDPVGAVATRDGDAALFHLASSPPPRHGTQF